MDICLWDVCVTTFQYFYKKYYIYIYTYIYIYIYIYIYTHIYKCTYICSWYMSICAVPHSDVFLYCLTRMGAQNITSFSRRFYVKATRNSLGMFHKVFQGTQISSLKVSNVEYFWTLNLHHRETLWLSPKHLHNVFKKRVLPKNDWMRHWYVIYIDTLIYLYTFKYLCVWVRG